MQHLALTVLLLVALLPVQAQPPDPVIKLPAPQPQPAKPRPKEPAKQIVEDIFSFVSSLNSDASHLWATTYVADARYGWFGAHEWFRYWHDHNTFDDGRYKLQVDDVQVDKIEGDDAQATVSYRLVPPRGDPNFEARQGAAKVEEFKETLQLHRQGKRGDGHLMDWEGFWGIVVGAPEEVLKKDRLSLERMALFIKQPPGIVAHIRAEESLTRLKQLGLAVLQFIQDNEEVYAFGPEYFQEALLPYTRSLRNFIIPGTGGEDFMKPPGNLGERYAFNARLSDQSSDKIADAARTVLFYEGQNEQLTFRYNGKAAVGFTDGHAALVDTEEAKNLRWEP